MVVSAGEGKVLAVTKNKRYEAHYDRLNDQRIEKAASRPAPVTLPPAAWGPAPIEWVRTGSHPSVWVWISWNEGVATRIPARAKGWNDRVVIVEWDGEGGFRDTVVWRTAVAQRSQHQRAGTELPKAE